MARRRVLDLYCGAGLAARGIRRAGYQVVGVDIVPQPNYPGEFHNEHAYHVLDVLAAGGAWFGYRREDFAGVWASPPCQFGSAMRYAPGAKQHRNMIPGTRKRLQALGLPYIIENVEGARSHLRDPVCLCGTMFGLGASLYDGVDWTYVQLQRHRYFETSFPFAAPRKCQHTHACIGVYGSHARVRAASVPGGRGTSWPFRTPQNAAASYAMGLNPGELTLAEMSQGIPPKYAFELMLGLIAASRK